jgi:hypothetical protein
MRAVGWSGVVAGLLVAWVAVAGAQENGVLGRKLVIVDKYDVSDRAKLVFVSKDGTPGAIHHGAAASPPALSGTVEVFPVQDPANRAVYELDAGGWLIQAATVARYVNHDAAPGGAGVRVLSTKPGARLKVVTKNLGDGDAATTDEGDTDIDLRALAGSETMRVVVTLENAADASTHVM